MNTSEITSPSFLSRQAEKMMVELGIVESERNRLRHDFDKNPISTFPALFWQRYHIRLMAIVRNWPENKLLLVIRNEPEASTGKGSAWLHRTQLVFELNDSCFKASGLELLRCLAARVIATEILNHIMKRGSTN